MARDEMVTAIVCERMHWDYFTYMRQPTWFVALIIEKLKIETKKQEEEMRKLRTKKK